MEREEERQGHWSASLTAQEAADQVAADASVVEAGQSRTVPQPVSHVVAGTSSTCSGPSGPSYSSVPEGNTWAGRIADYANKPAVHTKSALAKPEQDQEQHHDQWCEKDLEEDVTGHRTGHQSRVINPARSAVTRGQHGDQRRHREASNPIIFEPTPQLTQQSTQQAPGQDYGAEVDSGSSRTWPSMVFEALSREPGVSLLSSSANSRHAQDMDIASSSCDDSSLVGRQTRRRATVPQTSFQGQSKWAGKRQVNVARPQTSTSTAKTCSEPRSSRHSPEQALRSACGQPLHNFDEVSPRISATPNADAIVNKLCEENAQLANRVKNLESQVRMVSRRGRT